MEAAEATPDPRHDIVVDLAEVVDETKSGRLRTELGQVRGSFEISDISVSVRRICEAHGAWDGRNSIAASLIIWRFKIFNNGRSKTLGNRRVKSLKTTLRFENRPKGDPSDDPRIVSYAPASLGAIIIMPTEETRSESNEAGIEGSLEGPAPATPKISAHLLYNASREYKKNFAFKIDAETKDSSGRRSGRGGEDRIAWNMVENKSQKDGVSDTFILCVIVQRPTAEEFVVHLDFDADVDRSYAVEQKLNKLLKRWKPLAFNPQDDPYGLPDNHSLWNLKESAQGSILDGLSGIHVPEAVAPKTFYSEDPKVSDFPFLLVIVGALISFVVYYIWC